MMPLSEADIKLAVAEYLQYGQNQGKWMFLRLNAGDFIADKGTAAERLIKGCPAGTSDFLAIRRGGLEEAPAVIFIEVKAPHGVQTKKQKEFQAMVQALGAEYYVVSSTEELDILL